MKKFLIFKKHEDGTYGEKIGSYMAEAKDDSSGHRSHLEAEPNASHFEMPAGADEDCCVLVLVAEVPEKWTKEGEADASVDPEDMTWMHIPAIPAHYEAHQDAALVTAKAQATALRSIQNALSSAKAFGEQIMNDFTVENISLGITQAGMTGTVRKNMSEVIMALQTGSLYDAIVEAKAITADKKDATFITNARLLSFVNKIETKLGVTLSTSL